MLSTTPSLKRSRCLFLSSVYQSLFKWSVETPLLVFVDVFLKLPTIQFSVDYQFCLFYQGKGRVTTFWLLEAAQKPTHKPRPVSNLSNSIPSEFPLLSLPGFKSSTVGSSSSIVSGLKRSSSLRVSHFRKSQGSPILKRWQKLEDPPRQPSRDSLPSKLDPNGNQSTHM